MKRLTHEDFLSRARLIHGDKYRYPDVYKNARSKIKIICPQHGTFHQKAGNHLHQKQGCPGCNNFSGEPVRLTNEVFLDKARAVHGDTYEYPEPYSNSTSKITIHCRLHGNFEQRAGNHLYGKGCPQCGIRKSKGELAVESYLQNNNIEFISQWRDHDCKFKLPLVFDFYLPNEKTIIEFDGKQHYDPTCNWFSQEVVARDKIKNQWAKDNGITMLRIRHIEDIPRLQLT